MKQAQTGGFRMLPSYYDAIRNLPDRERWRLYDAIFDFGFGNEPEPLPPMSTALFTVIRPSLEKSVRFFEKQKANAEKPRKKPDAAKLSQTAAKLSLDSDSEGESDSDSESECESASASESESAR